MAMTAVVNAARSQRGVVHFDIARQLTDQNALVATEVFEDRAAIERECCGRIAHFEMGAGWRFRGGP